METLTLWAEIAVIGTINKYWFYSHRQNCSSKQNIETLTLRAEIAVIGTVGSAPLLVLACGDGVSVAPPQLVRTRRGNCKSGKL